MIACKCGYKSLNFFDSIARLKSVSTWCVSMAHPYFSCKRFWIAFCAVGMFLHSLRNRICLLFASRRAFVHFAFRRVVVSSVVSILYPIIRLQSCILGKKRGELPPPSIFTRPRFLPNPAHTACWQTFRETLYPRLAVSTCR